MPVARSVPPDLTGSVTSASSARKAATAAIGCLRPQRRRLKTWTCTENLRKLEVIFGTGRCIECGGRAERSSTSWEDTMVRFQADLRVWLASMLAGLAI